METTSYSALAKTVLLAFLAAYGFQVQQAKAQSGITYNPTARILADMARKGYSETVEDMHVKVLGGFIRINRTLIGTEWEFNQNWAPAIATSGCGGKKIMRGQYEYAYTGTETVTYQAEQREADIFAFFTDRRMIAIQDPNNPPPTAISPSSGSGGDSGPAIGCVDVPVEYLSIRWEDSFGNWIEYDGGNGRILRYGDRNDVQVSFDYDASGNLEGVNDHFGTRVVTYQYQTYATATRLVSVTDYTNRQVLYVWAADGSTLDTVLDVRGNIWTYSYDDDRRLTKIVDPEARQKIIVLNAAGGLNTVIFAEEGETEGVSLSHSYDYDPTTVEFTAIQKTSGGREEARTYDVDGFMIRRDINGTTTNTTEILNGTRKRVRTDLNGNSTVSEFDERNNLIKRTYADGTEISMSYNEFSLPSRTVDEVGTITLYEYDPNGNLERKTEAAGTLAERVTEFDYDEYGQVQEVRHLGDDNTQLSTHQFTYDNYGNIRTETDPLAEVSEWTYDVMGNVLTYTDRRRETWTMTYDNAGNMTSFKNPLNHLEEYTFDGVGNLIERRDADRFLTRMEYDARNNIVAVIDPLNGRVEYEYDGNDRPSSSKDQMNRVRVESYDSSARFALFRDAAGNETRFSYPDVGSTNRPYHQPETIDYPTYSSTFTYDRRARIKTMRNSLGGSEFIEMGFAYDAVGRLISKTDSRGGETRYSRDELGRTVKISDALSDDTTFALDDRDNVVAVTDPRLKTIQLEYDLNDRLRKVTQPLGQEREYTFDGEGNVTQILDANGQRVAYGYDSVGRLELIEHYLDALATTPDRTITFGYNARNLLETWTDGVTTGSRQYDDLSRLILETVNYGTFTLEFALTYNADSTIDTFTDADGTTYRYSYDSDGKPQSISIPGVGTIAVNDFTWLAPTQLTFPGGTTEAYEYTAMLEPSSIVVSDSAGTEIADRSMTYDGARNIVSINDRTSDNTYFYDAVNRLTGLDSSIGTDKEYTYDGMGNRTTLDGIATIWQYDDNNRLLNTGSSSFTYDDNGNVVTRTDGAETTYYIYDVANRLERVEDSSGSIVAEYGYDGFNRRVWKEVSGVRTYFLYSESGLIGEYDDTGSAVKTYGHVPGSQWGSGPVFMKADNGYNFFHNDHFGTPYMLTDQAGAITWQAKHLPFGAASVSVELITNNIRLPGQYFDSETGLHYNFNRTYDPSTGRYLQSDPLGLGDGVNTYIYARQNPLSFVDPLGLAVKGTFIEPPRYNHVDTDPEWTSFRLQWPEFNAWGYAKVFNIRARVEGFVNIDIHCTDGCEEWEFHRQVPVVYNGVIPFGPNVYALLASFKFGWQWGLIVNIAAIGGSALSGLHGILSAARDYAGPIIKEILDKGPTAYCLASDRLFRDDCEC